VLDPVDGVPGVPKPCAQVRILAGARLRWSQRRECDVRLLNPSPPLLSSVSFPPVVRYVRCVHHVSLTLELGAGASAREPRTAGS